MKKNLVRSYRCPISKEKLSISEEALFLKQEVIYGTLKANSGCTYKIADGIPDFTYPQELSVKEYVIRDEYDIAAEEIYDNYADWLFRVFYEDENKVRKKMIDLLHLKHESKVLEIGCGTGRDSIHIADQLNRGEFFIQDLSSRMVKKCKDNIRKYGSFSQRNNTIEFFVGNASYLPFPDGYFDAVFHFGGVNEFSEKELAIAEMARVVRIGGKVVFGDESMARWLRNTEYAKILMNNNRLLENEIPIDLLPTNAKDVRIRWILGNCFYLIDFKTGEGLPAVNLDLPHKGVRGGTCRTRYFGQLEGVTPETKKLAELAAKEAGLSMHNWLDKTVRENAESVLQKAKSFSSLK